MQTFSTLISATQLASLIDSKHAQSPLIILDCRFSLSDTELGLDDYKASHIPGAIYVHLDNDLAGQVTPDTGRHPLPDLDGFLQLMDAWGVTHDSQVVVYDDASGAIAGRLWWMMKWLGHNQVAVLDGGFSIWKESEQPLSGQPESANVSARDEGFVAKPNNSLVIDAEEIQGLLDTDQIKLFDARSGPRFLGEHELIDVVAGHIPGAINLPFDQNLNSAGLFLKPEALAQRFKTVLDSGDMNKQIVHMCGSGVTACHNILALEIAGILSTSPPIRLYVGSWSEWIRDSQRPVSLKVSI